MGALPPAKFAPTRIGRTSKSCSQRPQSNTTVSKARPERAPSPPLQFVLIRSKAPETDAVEAMPLLRAVIHECHRFLLFYPDPSELIMQPPRPPSPEQKPCKRSEAKTPAAASQRQSAKKGKDAPCPEEPVSSPDDKERSRSVILFFTHNPFLLVCVCSSFSLDRPCHFPPVPIWSRNSQPPFMPSLESPSSCSAT